MARCALLLVEMRNRDIESLHAVYFDESVTLMPRTIWGLGQQVTARAGAHYDS